MTLAEKIATVVLVMLENRSFDHMLGHLRYEGLMPTVDGLEKDLSKYNNPYKGGEFVPFQARDRQLTSDLPHEWQFVDTQLAWSPVRQQFEMTGFVQAYADFTKTNPGQQADPMGFFTSDKVPITSFLARHFRVCERWHAPYRPTPNRIGRWPFAGHPRSSTPNLA
jgi:phospholipase C